MPLRPILSVVLLAAISCTGSREVVEIRRTRVQDSVHVETREIQEKEIDPMSWYRPLQSPRTIRLARDLEDQIVVESAELPVEKKHGPSLGFRVQLYSTRDYYEAINRREEALQRFQDSIHLDFDAPYYKIRLGDYADRDAAETARLLARTLGYADAWIVRTPIAQSEEKD